MRRRTAIISALSAFVVLSGVGVAVAVAAGSFVTPSAKPSAGATASPSPSIVGVALPHVAMVEGTLADWQLASPTAVGAVGPEVGDAAEGSVALVVDAPTVDAPIRVAQATAPAVAGETYSVSARVRTLTSEPVAVPAALEVGATEIALPKLDAEWTEITGTVNTDGASDLAVALRVDAPVTGLAIDDIVVADPQGTNIVANPSFENVTYAHRLVNSSLLMRSATATLAVVLTPGDAQWTVTRGEGADSDPEVAQGTLTSDGSVATIPVASLEQGYYAVQITDAGGTKTAARFAIVDGAVSTDDARFGVGVHVEDEIYDSAARYARSVGIAEVRTDVLWSRNEKVAGQYDWDPIYADGFDKMHQNGVKVLGIVNYGNKLYSDNDKVPDNAAAIAAYGRYAGAIAQRFDLVGLEVFNEFNQGRFNTAGCGVDPSCYMPLLASVHDAVAPISPELPIIAGATANYDAEWFDGLWKAGGMTYADAMSFHPYEVAQDPTALAGIIDSARQGMQIAGGGQKPIWITELGATSNGASMTEHQQADFLFKAVTTALGNGVEKFFWYDLINDSPDPSNHEGNFGLFSPPVDGVAALPPKPSGFVYALLIDAIRDLPVNASAPALAAGVSSFEFGTGDGAVTVAYPASGSAAAVKVPTDVALEVVTTDGLITHVEPSGGTATVEIPIEGAIILSSGG